MSQYFRKYIKKEYYPNHYNIKFKTTFRNCVYLALRNRGWKETDNDDFNLLWCEKQEINQLFQHVHLASQQKVNHYRLYTEVTSFKQLCRKDLLNKNIKRAKRALEKEGKKQEAQKFNFLPQTYALPSQYMIFADQFKKYLNYSNENNIWIMKPVNSNDQIGKCQGKGIFLFNKVSRISEWKNKYGDHSQPQPYIVQKYLDDPLLIGNKKFDMRIYILCLSYSPLTIYLNRSGFARFAHQRYDNKDLDNLCIFKLLDAHLTNVAIQKYAEGYDNQKGGKMDLPKLKQYLISKYGQQKVSQCFFAIQNLIIVSLQTVQKLVANDKHCFQLYGYDVILDSNLKPWLLQVNAGPSMVANTTKDCQLKCGIIDDVMTILDFEKMYLSIISLIGNQQSIGGFDLIFKNGEAIKMPSNSAYKNYLGCNNDRKLIYKSLAITRAKQLQKEYYKNQQLLKNSKNQKKNITKNMYSTSARPSITTRFPVNSIKKKVSNPNNFNGTTNYHPHSNKKITQVKITEKTQKSEKLIEYKEQKSTQQTKQKQE